MPPLQVLLLQLYARCNIHNIKQRKDFRTLIHLHISIHSSSFNSLVASRAFTRKAGLRMGLQYDCRTECPSIWTTRRR